jgi:hypothetical protein
MGVPYKGFLTSMHARKSHALVRIHVFEDHPDDQHKQVAACGEVVRTENVSLLHELKRASTECVNCRRFFDLAAK